MYLTDDREQCLKDVIKQIDSKLFTKVIGFDIKYFDMLCEIGAFNSELMNDAIYKFKRYEDSSLIYTGMDKHNEEYIGGFDTQITRQEFYEQNYEQDYDLDEVTVDNNSGFLYRFMNMFRKRK